MSSRKRRYKKSFIGNLLLIILIFISLLVVGFLFVKAMIVNKNNNSGSLLYEKISDSELNKDNNYVLFSNYLFRMINVNMDGSIDMVLSSPVNYLMWNNVESSYINSDINKYLNSVFLSKLDKDYLTNTAFCNEEVKDINNYNCKKKDNSYFVRLLDVSEYVNSDMGISDDSIWLGNISDGLLYVGNKGKIYSDNFDSFNGVLPVITLKNNALLDNGDGTVDNPYEIKTKIDSLINSYIKLGDDLWKVFDADRNKLSLIAIDLKTSVSMNHRFSNDEDIYDNTESSNVLYYLNDEFYNSLGYKDMLIKFDTKIGEYYGDYKDISKSINLYVGMPSVDMLKYDISGAYYLTNGTGKKVYYYNDGVILSNYQSIRPIKPTISISNKYKFLGNGTIDNPYYLEEDNEK